MGSGHFIRLEDKWPMSQVGGVGLGCWRVSWISGGRDEKGNDLVLALPEHC